MWRLPAQSPVGGDGAPRSADKPKQALLGSCDGRVGMLCGGLRRAGAGEQLPCEGTLMNTQVTRNYELKAITPIWTGDYMRRGDRLIPTGIMGSLRWWFEVLVRGLGGAACDPTDRNYCCPGGSKRKATDSEHHCVACELFGCTGWARKFRLMLTDQDNEVFFRKISENDTFNLRFIQLRPITSDEWYLLDRTLHLIADYGAIGGHTIFKPSIQPDRENQLHHKDYGIMKINKCDLLVDTLDIETARKYVKGEKWRKVDNGPFSWASLENFWVVNGMFLARQSELKSTFNRVIGREEAKNRSTIVNNDRHSRWLAGKQGESKKVFSFRVPHGGRTFGFTKPGTIKFDDIERRLKDAIGPNKWKELTFIRGAEVIERLFNHRVGD